MSARDPSERPTAWLPPQTQEHDIMRPLITLIYVLAGICVLLIVVLMIVVITMSLVL